MTLEELKKQGLDCIKFEITGVDYNFEMPIRLSNVVFWLRFWWFERAEYGSWSFDFLAPDKSPIALGIRLVPNHCLLRRVTDARRPPGILMLTDPAKSGEEPTRTNLGKRFYLVYAIPA